MRSLCLLPLSLFFATCPAYAQQLELKSKDFSYLTSDRNGEQKTDQFCLPAGERLIDVEDVGIENSNKKSAINVTPDLKTNCINLDIKLQPAQQICTKIPKMTFKNFYPTVEQENSCVTIPTTINFSVKYKSAVDTAVR